MITCNLHVHMCLRRSMPARRPEGLWMHWWIDRADVELRCLQNSGGFQEGRVPYIWVWLHQASGEFCLAATTRLIMCVMRRKLDTCTRCGAILISIQRRYSCNPDVDAIQMLCAIDVLVQS